MANSKIKSKTQLVSEIDKLKSKVAELEKVKQELYTSQLHYTEKVEFSQNRFEDMVNSTDGIVWEADAQTFQFNYISDKAERLLGYPIKDWFKPGFWAKHIVDSDRERAVNYCASFTKKMLAHDFEYRFLSKNGTIFWLRDLVSVVTKDGKPYKLRGVMIDITKQKNIENELIKSEQKLLEFHEITKLGSFIFDDSTDLFESSKICDEILGIDSSFIKNIQGWISLAHPEDYEKVQVLFDNNSLKPISQEFRIIRPKDKKTIWVLGYAKKEYDNKGVRTKIIGTIQDITDQKLIEEKSKNLNNRLSISISSMPNAYILLNKKLHVTEWNKAAEKIFGYSKQEMLGKNPVNYIVPKKDRAIINDVLKKLKTGEVASHTAKDNNIRKDGKIISCQWNNALLVDENDTVFGILIIAKDITKILQTEEELKKLSVAVEQSANTIVITDTKGNVEYINPKFTELTGYTEADIIGKNQRLLKSGNQSETLYANMWQTITSGNIWQGEFQNKSKSGNLFWEYLTITPIKNETGKIVNFLGIKEDITVQKLAQQALKVSEEKYQDLYDHAPDMFVSVCPESANILQCNQTLLNNLGYTRKEVIGKPIFNVYHPDCMDDVHKAFKLFTEKGEVKNAELQLKRKDGSKIYVILNVSSIRDKQGKIISSRSSWRDISELKLVEKALWDSENQYHTLYDNAPDMYVSVNPKTGKVVQCNQTTLNNLGYTKEEIVGHLVFNLYQPSSIPDAKQAFKLFVKTGTVFNQELTLKRKDGSTLDVLMNTSSVRDKEGKILYSMCNWRNITERKIVGQKLKESEEFLNLTGEIAKVGGWELNLNTQIVKWSKETKKIHEVDETFKPNLGTAINFYHPDDRDMVREFVNKSIETGEQYEFEARIITAKGNSRYVMAKGQPVFKNGKCERLYGAFQDITERKKIEEELANYRKQLEVENVFLKEEIALSFNYEDMVYSSTEISEVLTQVEQVSSTDATVLVLGETGTGKELIAKAIHNTSDRKNNPLIRVNCAAIPTELIESELFGHLKGSFTSAFSNRIGKFELANGGTLFLDEIGELQLALQPKLLRAIQEGEIEPIGSSKIRKLDVRIIAATNKDLKKEVENKRFREDLYFRLNVFPITVPALRERTEDIPVLIDHFVNKFSTKHGKKIKYISDIALQQMKTYSWPGNVRELENLIERAVIISNKDRLELKEFDQSTQQKKSPIKNYKDTLEEVQRNHILKILNKTQWKIDGKTGAAVLLDMKPSTLRDRMKKFGIARVKV